MASPSRLFSFQVAIELNFDIFAKLPFCHFNDMLASVNAVERLGSQVDPIPGIGSEEGLAAIFAILKGVNHDAVVSFGAVVFHTSRYPTKERAVVTFSYLFSVLVSKRDLRSKLSSGSTTARRASMHPRNMCARRSSPQASPQARQMVG